MVRTQYRKNTDFVFFLGQEFPGNVTINHSFSGRSMDEEFLMNVWRILKVGHEPFKTFTNMLFITEMS